MLPDFSNTAILSEFVAHLEELMRRMNAISCSPTEPHFQPVGKISANTWENCRETLEKTTNEFIR